MIPITPVCVDATNDKILIVEDSKTFSSLLFRTVRAELGCEAVVCRNYQEAAQLLALGKERFYAALLDLNLPDAPSGEVVDLVTGSGIPSVVFTGEISEAMREAMWSRRILDYVLKESMEDVRHVVGLLGRLRRNAGKKVLVVDDSSASRRLIGGLLEIWGFVVLEASDGREALAVLRQETGTALVIADYEMPGMDGLALIREIRKLHPKSKLPVIGLSGTGTAASSARFIKAGANDYMHKPFLTEELYCRVMNNIENVEHIALIKDLAERDALTGLYNRRSFFDFGSTLYQTLKTGGRSMLLAMLDIDHFKRCNDTYGHVAGDEMIRVVAGMLAARFGGGDVTARLGGEEFCVLSANDAGEEPLAAFDALRREIAATVVDFKGREIRVTVSVGVCHQPCGTLEEMLHSADMALYQAKNGGRDRVCLAAS